jgi:Flp pilus assembly pilin Flp
MASLGVELLWLSASRSGATAIEYALIAALIVLILIPLHTSIGNSVVGFFMAVATGL